MSEASFVRGSLCLADHEVDVERSVVVAEVFEQALEAGDKGLVACYFLAHGLEAVDAEKAMTFFASRPSLLVDAERLVADSGARFPALVVIRYSDETPVYLGTMHEYGMLRELPDDAVVSRSGWELFWALEALEAGSEVPAAAPLPNFDYRGLRRKVLARRAATAEDREPFMRDDLRVLRRITEGEPEGCEKFLAEAADMEAALSGSIEVAEGYSVVIPTLIERQRPSGALVEWIPQAGREIVVAHGLDAIQAARALRVVRADPEAFVAKGRLASRKAREALGQAMVVPDMGLNWISTDFTGRRNPNAYDVLRGRIATADGHAGRAPQRAAGR